MAETAVAGRRLLIIEDDANISEAVRFNLEKQGYRCSVASDGLAGLRMLRTVRPDLLVLDLMLPGMDGWQICEQLRAEGNGMPVIIISARTSEYDKVHALSIGADDYLAKPFGMKELVARVDALLRRTDNTAGHPRDMVTRAGRLTIDTGRKEVSVDGELIPLTPKEFSVLALVAAETPRPVSREDIYRSVWGYEMLHGDRSVDVFVKRIRNKLGKALPGQVFLKTRHGFGYSFEEAPE